MRATLAFLLAFLLTAPAFAADELIYTYHVEASWWWGAPPGPGSVFVELNDTTTGFSTTFSLPAMPVGQVSRIEGLDLSVAKETNFWFWLGDLGYNDGGFHSTFDQPMVSLEDFRSATIAELEVLKWDYTPGEDCVGCGANGETVPLYYITDFWFDFHIYRDVVPEPSTLALAAAFLFPWLRCQRE